MVKKWLILGLLVLLIIVAIVLVLKIKPGERGSYISPAPSSPTFHAVETPTISNPTQPIVDGSTDLPKAATSLSPSPDSQDFDNLNQQINNW